MRRRSVVAASALGALGKLMSPIPAAASVSAQAWSGLEIVDESSVFINVTIAGKRRTALLDTGAAATVLDLKLARELQLAAVGQRTLRGYSDVGAFNELSGFTAEVGGAPVAFSRAVSTDLAVISSSLGRPTDLIVGHDDGDLAVLRRFKITFDFDGGRVWFAPSRKEVAKPFREDHSGLGVAFLTDRLVVKHVAARSPASAEGWKEGDEIVAVDGVPVSRVYADARLRAWRERSPGSSVTLTMASGAKRRIVLADYY